MDKCIHCDCPVDHKEAKWWRWAGWVAYGNAPSAPAPPSCPPTIKVRDWERTKRDFFDFLFHKECFPEWLNNRNEFIQDLDRPMNVCAYFERHAGSYGFYVRDGKKHVALAPWTEYDIMGISIFPLVEISSFTIIHPSLQLHVVDNLKLVASFREFLKTNGWLNADWYKHRREPVYKFDVSQRMKVKYTNG